MAAIVTNVLNSSFEAATNEHENSLQQFFSKFSKSEKLVDKINPLATFEVYMKFKPHVSEINTATNNNVLKKDYLNTFLNNASGGLYNSLKTEFSGTNTTQKNEYASVIDEHNNFKSVGVHTFIEYLAKANLLVGSENWNNTKQTIIPLELQLGFYTQSITIPKIKIPDGAKSTTLIGEFPINGTYVIPDNNQLQMDILCTKLPLHERLFYPWMREVTLPFWSYDTQPYTTAIITVDFSKHTDLQYVFCGCRPTQIETIQPLQEPSAPITRQVTFTFDFMFIESKNLPITEALTNNNELNIASGKSLVNTVNKFI